MFNGHTEETRWTDTLTPSPFTLPSILHLLLLLPPPPFLLRHLRECVKVTCKPITTFFKETKCVCVCVVVLVVVSFLVLQRRCATRRSREGGENSGAPAVFLGRFVSPPSSPCHHTRESLRCGSKAIYIFPSAPPRLICRQPVRLSFAPHRLAASSRCLLLIDFFTCLFVFHAL